jgi:sugar O-acyltransferase (sialic acid O-acetyltransferase NeuD family)
MADTNDTVYGIYGAGGSGLSLSFFIQNNPLYENIINRIFFIDDNKKLIEKKEISGFPIFSYEDFKLLKYKKKRILISINDIDIKKKIFKKIEDDNLNFWSYIDNTSKIVKKNIYNNSSYFAPFTLINNSSKIGSCFSCNIYSYVEHESQIGDFVTFAPGVKCNGNVIIQDNVYIGTGVIINNGTTSKKIIIGENSFISAGTVVNKDVPKNSRIIGSQRIKNAT